MGAIAVLKNKYRSWLAHQFAARDVPDKFTKMSKCAEIISELKENVILFCWKKGGLIQGEDPVVPQDCENVEESQDEERVLNRVIERWENATSRMKISWWNSLKLRKNLHERSKSRRK